ncbi:MAG: TraR/DksA family transcriptional regulator [Gammaproteobacteria bacterium]|nr:conjugal transfer protein TraR [Gammaproteobacteria bacterium]
MTLDTQQLAELTARLRERAAQLREEIRSTLERSSDETHVQLAHTVRDEGDDSFLDLIVHLNLSDIDRDAQELRRIDAALLRIQEGTFGYCSDCDQEIPWERLRAEPTAVRCVRCQELYERTHVSPSTPTM